MIDAAPYTAARASSESAPTRHRHHRARAGPGRAVGHRLPIDFVNAALDLVQSTIGTDIAVTTEIAWLFLFVGNVLLIVGSLLPGI